MSDVAGEIGLRVVGDENPMMGKQYIWGRGIKSKRHFGKEKAQRPTLPYRDRKTKPNLVPYHPPSNRASGVMRLFHSVDMT